MVQRKKADRRHNRTVRNAARAATSSRSKLAKALQTIATGLPNPADESTDYFRGFHAPMDAGIVLGPATFHTALAIGRRYEIDISPADDLFANAEDPASWGEELADGFHLLATVMRATLTELSVAHARAKGVVRVRMWLFGRAANGGLVGLRSISTET